MSEIIEVINYGSIYLLLLDSPQGIEEVSVDHRMMAHIVEGEGLDDPQDLRGLVADVTDDGTLQLSTGGDGL
jgi:hypothetical protein